eukprot:CAMPEP_0175755202 /NCGR_PEP_ID=MMETSP0097-20121207/63264_1 /TAXON_ID=311494 /ORGANISM="Alexandrium monilatum, Strain CCMP3105" /LENGTH=47 /DNA_ID= /DNA_START= /DNA_END= /DNA_ORIENTATION=
MVVTDRATHAEGGGGPTPSGKAGASPPVEVPLRRWRRAAASPQRRCR